jgi:PHD/YefM family antitoxin component YafN of YafNO toxin-antitoxin module
VGTREIAMVLSVQQAKARLEELVVAAAANPVEIAAEDGRTAMLVSKQDFVAMLATVEELTDQLWLVRAEMARKGGFVGSDVAHAEADSRERG